MAGETDIRSWLHLHLVPEIGAVTFRRLVAHFGTPAAALAAGESELRAVEGIGSGRAAAIVKGRAEADPDAELARAEKLGVRIITPECPDYPELLRHIHDPPAVLYVRGAITPADGLAMAVVGSRDCSVYGAEQAGRLSAAMAGAGITVVSGLAKGVDTAAHRGALSVRGRTIAVQGCGLAHVYPSENRRLADEIAASGAVVSEFPLDSRPQSHHFPMRNRIISGMSLGVLVVEAPLQSGSLITASQATGQNREVMAVPGRIDSPGSRGCHSLIKSGAKLVEGLEDILDGLGEPGRLIRESVELAKPAPAATNSVESRPPKPAAPKLPLNETEQKIIAALADGPADVDSIVRSTGLAAAVVSSTLTRLELKSVVRPEPGGKFARRG